MLKRLRPQPEKLLRELAEFGKYDDPIDAYREFRLVLLGTDPAMRVTNQIMTWGHIMASTADPDPIQMAILNGERNLALKILSTLETEPTILPKRTRSR